VKGGYWEVTRRSTLILSSIDHHKGATAPPGTCGEWLLIPFCQWSSVVEEGVEPAKRQREGVHIVLLQHESRPTDDGSTNSKY
jgi:hypothetical protein